jgi:hypothetical protein
MIEKTMLLITGDWDKQKSFRLIPVSKECPYAEGIFIPSSKALVLMSVLTKENFHMLPKIDDDGNHIQRKKMGQNNVTYKEQRVSLETFQEYYISEQEEIINLINLMCINSNEFNYQKYMTSTPIVIPEAKFEVVQ